VRRSSIELLGAHLDQNPAALPPIPGAHGFIDYLENHENYQFAVATSGWRFSAEMKLTAAGFDFDDWVLYTCTEHEYKKEAMKAAT
jgi:beta-phosphoglucomutase-like phosphatase (HAD superfamily)